MFKVGDRVEWDWYGGELGRGKVREVLGGARNGLVSVISDEDDMLYTLDRSSLRPAPAPEPAFKVGDRVQEICGYIGSVASAKADGSLLLWLENGTRGSGPNGEWISRAAECVPVPAPEPARGVLLLPDLLIPTHARETDPTDPRGYRAAMLAALLSEREAVAGYVADYDRERVTERAAWLCGCVCDGVRVLVPVRGRTEADARGWQDPLERMKARLLDYIDHLAGQRLIQ